MLKNDKSFLKQSLMYENSQDVEETKVWQVFVGNVKRQHKK